MYKAGLAEESGEEEVREVPCSQHRKQGRPHKPPEQSMYDGLKSKLSLRSLKMPL